MQATLARHRTQITELLLAALAQAYTAWTGITQLQVDLESHGRDVPLEGVDVSRTVGWFTAIYPLLLDISDAESPGDVLRIVKEQARRVPGQGVGYGLLRYLGEPEVAAALQALPPSEILFNYLGQVDQVFADGSVFVPAYESRGPDRSSRNHRPYLVEISGMVAESSLRFNWVYSSLLHRKETIEAVAQAFINALRSYLSDDGAHDFASLTPSDFPLAQLTVDELGAALEQIEFDDQER